MFVHEDDRRKLHELSGDFKTCKAILVKQDSVLGDHFHRGKDEEFLLLHGRAARVVIGGKEWFDADAPQHWIVPRGTYHVFWLQAGSVLIGTATAPFDPADEISGEPL